MFRTNALYRRLHQIEKNEMYVKIKGPCLFSWVPITKTVSGRKRLSGAECRKQKAQRERNLQKQSGSRNKYINIYHKELGVLSELGCLDGSSDKLPSLSIAHNTSSSSSDDCGNVPNGEHSEARVDITISNPGSWPQKLTDSLRVSVVKPGPAKPDPMYEYPKDALNRRFTVANTKRRLKNGEEVNRPWSVYSEIKNAVFCLCCKLFSSLDVALKNLVIMIGEICTTH
jgi:hypothetical protein